MQWEVIQYCGRHWFAFPNWILSCKFGFCLEKSHFTFNVPDFALVKLNFALENLSFVLTIQNYFFNFKMNKKPKTKAKKKKAVQTQTNKHF